MHQLNVSTGADSLAQLPVSLYSLMPAWQSYCFLPSCSMCQHGWDHKRQTEDNVHKWCVEENRVRVCFYLYFGWPILRAVSSTVQWMQFTSEYLYAQTIAVCRGIMNSVHISFGRCWMSVSMATILRMSQVVEINFTSESYFVFFSLFCFSLKLFLAIDDFCL